MEVTKGWVLAGKFLSKRRINLEVVVKALKPIWKATENFEIQDIGDNTTLFLFQNEEDMNRVLWASPWSFDKYLLVLQKLGKGDSVSSLSFDKTPFWIQIHGLPLRTQTTELAKKIASSMGVIENVDVGPRGFCVGKYLRLRLTIDISKPLCRGKVVRMGGNEKGWVDFRYKRFPIFCYWCGKLDHDNRDCPLWIDSKESLALEERQFGPWLQADPGRLQRPQVAKVPNRKNGGEGKSKEGAHQCNTRNANNNRWSPRVVCDNSEISPPPKEAAKVSDLVMTDVTPQEKKLVNFEEQLLEINSTINDDVTVQELTGIKELKKCNRGGLGFLNIEQPEVLGTGVKEKVNRTQIQSPDLTADSTSPYGLAKELNEAQKGQGQFALTVEEGDRVLRSRGGEVLQKDHS